MIRLDLNFFFCSDGIASDWSGCFVGFFFFSNGKNPQTFATSTCFSRLQGWSLDSVSKEWMPMGSLDEATDFLVEAQREANCQKVFGGQ